jgi:hypothetical protein
MALDALRIYESPYPKIRVGNEKDGGYVIADLDGYDLLLSCGIANDISFEVDFLKKHNIKCIGFDGTVDGLPEENPNIQFVKKNISWMETKDTTNLHNIINQYNNIFLKMDIETFEFRWLLSLQDELLANIKQIVIEFHFPFNEPGFTHLDQPLPVELKLNALKTLTTTHVLVHLHPNNCCGTRVFNGVTVPNVFECTYIRKDLVSEMKLNTIPIPHPLDKPNTKNPEIYLSGYPFTV